MRFFLTICVAAALACGGAVTPTDLTGSASFNGTVHGKPVTATDASSAVVQGNVSGVVVQSAGILISSAPGICSTLASGKQPKSWQYLALGAAEQQGSTIGPPRSPGAFTIITGPTTETRIAVAQFHETDASCTDLGAAGDASAVSGTVTLTTVGLSYAGSFDLMLDTGERVSGLFKAPGCGAAALVLQSAPPPICQ